MVAAFAPRCAAKTGLWLTGFWLLPPLLHARPIDLPILLPLLIQLAPFDPHILKREMQIIHDDLHATAVRVTGGDPERLEIAAAFAAEAGLEVWSTRRPVQWPALSRHAVGAETRLRHRRRPLLRLTY